jgi:flagellar protein FliO/FliZ
VLGVTEHGVTVIDKLPGRGPSARRGAGRGRAADAVEPTEPGAGTAAFERLLASESHVAGSSTSERHDSEEPVAVTADAAQPLSAGYPLRRDRVAPRTDPLHGSILSPSTWRQTVDFLRNPR